MLPSPAEEPFKELSLGRDRLDKAWPSLSAVRERKSAPVRVFFELTAPLASVGAHLDFRQLPAHLRPIRASLPLIRLAGLFRFNILRSSQAFLLSHSFSLSELFS